MIAACFVGVTFAGLVGVLLATDPGLMAPRRQRSYDRIRKGNRK